MPRKKRNLGLLRVWGLNAEALRKRLRMLESKQVLITRVQEVLSLMEIPLPVSIHTI